MKTVTRIDPAHRLAPERPPAAHDAALASWFVYGAGRLEPSSEPDWMAGDLGRRDYDAACTAEGFVRVETCGSEGCYSLEIYEHGDRPRWLFVFGWNRVYTVGISTFPDYIEFLSKLAPVATVGLLADLAFKLERQIKRR